MGAEGRESDVFAAIAAPARREILVLLSKGALPVTTIAESFSMSLSAVSQHLTILKDAHLVEITRAGRQRIYRLTPNPLLDVVNWLGQYQQFWPNKLDRLGSYLEKNDERKADI